MLVSPDSIYSLTVTFNSPCRTIRGKLAIICALTWSKYYTIWCWKYRYVKTRNKFYWFLLGRKYPLPLKLLPWIISIRSVSWLAMQSLNGLSGLTILNASGWICNIFVLSHMISENVRSKIYCRPASDKLPASLLWVKKNLSPSLSLANWSAEKWCTAIVSLFMGYDQWSCAIQALHTKYALAPPHPPVQNDLNFSNLFEIWKSDALWQIILWKWTTLIPMHVLFTFVKHLVGECTKCL